MAGAARGSHVGDHICERDGALCRLPRDRIRQRTIPLSALPISLNGEKISALVVGGGKVGTRKALAMLGSGATVRVISPVVTAELAEAADANKSLVIDTRTYAGVDDIGQCQIVFAATDSPEVNATVAADARSRFRLASIVDAPSDGTFISMAVHRVGPVTVGVSTGNVPTAAGKIRDAIAERIDDRYGDAVAACARLRADALASGGSAEWGRIHPSLIGPDFCARVENATFSEEIAACRS